MLAVEPWRVVADPADVEMYAVAGAYMVACKLPIEDANLIAAAPDLYAALERARWLLRAICGADGNYPDEREILKQATDALAKARGEQHT